jgi:hypothetical protein
MSCWPLAASNTKVQVSDTTMLSYVIKASNKNY